MNAELFEALELLEKTKGIPVDYMLEKVEAALVSAFKKEYGSASVRVDINKAKKDVKVYRRRTVVEEVVDPKSEISYEDAQAISRRYELGHNYLSTASRSYQKKSDSSLCVLSRDH